MLKRVFEHDAVRLVISLFCVFAGLYGLIANAEYSDTAYWTDIDRMAFQIGAHGVFQILSAGVMWSGVEGVFAFSKFRSIGYRNAPSAIFLNEMTKVSYRFFIILILMDIILFDRMRREGVPGTGEFVLGIFCLAVGSVLTIILNQILRAVALHARNK